MQTRQPLGLRIIFFILTVFFIGSFVSAGIAQEEEETPEDEEVKQDIPEPKKRQSHLYDEERREGDTWFRDGYDYGILKDEKNGIGQEWRGEMGTYSGEWEGGRAEGDLFYHFNDEPSEVILDPDELAPAPLPEIQTEQPETPETPETDTETAGPEDKPSTEPGEGSATGNGQAPL